MQTDKRADAIYLTKTLDGIPKHQRSKYRREALNAARQTYGYAVLVLGFAFRDLLKAIREALCGRK